jgi:hypothetical protein
MYLILMSSAFNALYQQLFISWASLCPASVAFSINFYVIFLEEVFPEQIRR